MKWSNPGKRAAPSPTPRCSSYWKGNLQVVFDHGRQLYLLYWCIYAILNAGKPSSSFFSKMI